MNAPRPSPARVALLLVALPFVLLVGCRGGENESIEVRRSQGSATASERQSLFDNALTNFNQLYEYGPDEILLQSIDRLNEWASTVEPQVEWRRDPALVSLPDELQQVESLQDLDRTRYTLDDAEYLRQAVWTRDISTALRGGAFDDLVLAERLFDWVVRNVQLEPEPPLDALQPIRYRPDEALLFGRGRAVEKAWIFLLLARQQHLDGVMLALPDETAAGGYRAWLPAIYLDGQFYLFEMSRSTPLPGPDGQGIATLAQAREDETILKQLDVEGFPYPVAVDELDDVAALVPVQAETLSRRMLVIQNQLAGDKRMVLFIDASARIARLEQSDQLSAVRLWPRAFEIEQERRSPLPPPSLKAVAVQMDPFELDIPQLRVNPLWAGRLLQFKGQYTGKDSARSHYLAARETAQNIDPRTLSEEVRQLRAFLRLTATFWLGQVSMDLEEYEVAADYFGPRLLGTYGPNPWQTGALYNFARAQEALGNTPMAIVNYEQDHSPMRPSSLLRARRLMESLSAERRAEVEEQVDQLRAELEARRQAVEAQAPRPE